MSTLKKTCPAGGAAGAEEKLDRINNANNNTNNRNNNITINKRLKQKKNNQQHNKNQSTTTQTTKRTFTEETQLQYDKEDLTWGNEVVLNEEWPLLSSNDDIRILGLNVKGIGTGGDLKEFETLLTMLDRYQVEVACLSEINVDTRNPTMRYDIFEKVKQQDLHSKVTFTSSHCTPKTRESYYKPGGTMTLVRGTISGRSVEVEASIKGDNLGRWTSTHMRCKGNHILTIISTYRVNPFNAAGDNTIYQQQQADYLKKRKRVIDPRDQICKDLEAYLMQLLEHNHKIILCADANDDMNQPKKGMWNMMLAKTGMRNVHSSKHPERKLPRTYNKGSKCIDIIAVSENIPDEAIKRAGILPFYSMNATDHRPMYVDIDRQILFGDIKPDQTKATYRRFNTNNVKKCDTYIKNLDRMFEENRIYKKVSNLHQRAMKLLAEEGESGDNKEQLITEIKVLEKKRSQLMIGAERKCGKAPMQGQFWYSIKLHEAVMALRDAKIEVLQANETNNVQEQKKAQKKRNQALQHLRDVQKNDRQNRDEMLDLLAEKRGKQWQQTTQSALKSIKATENMKGIFKRITNTVKGVRKGGIRHLYIPTNENDECIINKQQPDDPQQWIQINDTEEMFELLLKQNTKMLIKSANGITASGPLGERLGQNLEGHEATQQILEGTFPHEKIIQQYPNAREETLCFLQQMKRDELGQNF